MARLNLTGRLLAAGRTIMGPYPVPTGLDHFVLSVDTTQHLNPGVVVALGVEVSQDGGGTWQVLTTTVREGGTVNDDDGVAITTMRIETQLGHPENAQRQVRFGVQVQGGSFVTAGGTCDVT